MTRPRVLVLTKTAALGGAERLLINALPHLDRDAFDYRVAVCDPDGPLAEACARARVPFRALPHPGALDPRNALALRRVVRRDRIDLVHAHLPLPGALARVATRGLRARVVYSEHNTQEMYRRPSRLLNAATYGWQTRVVAVSEGVRASALARMGRRAAARTVVVPNGVDFAVLDREAARGLRAPLPACAPGAFRVLVPATLDRRKGQDVMLRALALLAAREGPDVHVWLAGTGPGRARLEAQALRARLLGRVGFLGPRRDVFAVMGCADAVALPSRFEGHPLALLEAMALGRPVVATRVGGVPEIVEAGRSGLLVPPGDAGALADSLQCLRVRPALRARLGAAAAASARARFDIRRAVAQVEAVYRGALGAPRAQTPARPSST